MCIICVIYECVIKCVLYVYQMYINVYNMCNIWAANTKECVFKVVALIDEAILRQSSV